MGGHHRRDRRGAATSATHALRTEEIARNAKDRLRASVSVDRRGAVRPMLCAPTMSTPQPKPDPEKKPAVDAAMREEIKKRARGVVDAAKAWLPPKSGDDRSAEELAKAVAPLEVEEGRGAVVAALSELEQWVERRFDTHVAGVAKDRGVSKGDLLGDEAGDAKGWLKDALSDELVPVDAALAERKSAAQALVSLDAPADDAALAAPRRAFAEAGELLAKRLGAVEAAIAERVAARWTVRVEKLASEGEERAMAAVRERAERAALRRVAPKKPASDASDDADDGDGKGGGRRWYHWVLDAALLGAAAYLVYTRFIAKPPQPPQEAASAASSSSGSAGTSGARPALSGVPIGATEVRAGPGMLYAPVETLGAPSRVQLLEGPTSGWVKVKTASSKEGWIPVGAIGPAPTAVPAPSASASASK
jgi:hypothetical protein